MPVMDGYDATVKIRKDDELKDTPVFALTASAMKGEEQRLKDAGCNAYITKPVDKKRLYREIIDVFPENVAGYSEETDSDNDEHIFDGEIVKKEELLKTFENDILERKDRLKNTMIIGELMKFTGYLEDLANSHNAGAVKKYATELEKLSNNFDILNIRKKLDEIPELYKNIQNQ